MIIFLAAENDTALSNLVDRALAGDGVVLTRAGKAVVEVRAVPSEKQRLSKEDMLKWLDERRIPVRDGYETPSETLEELRDSY
jgi:antitoxin (DNA-binding transcriptional repressor) of toxin-antitoxin stability system